MKSVVGLLLIAIAGLAALSVWQRAQALPNEPAPGAASDALKASRAPAQGMETPSIAARQPTAFSTSLPVDSRWWSRAGYWQTNSIACVKLGGKLFQ